MYPTLARFDELHHVHRNQASRTTPKHTVFSFMSNYNYVAYVTVPGHPRLEPGMMVMASLREPGDWKTLVGWQDLDTGELVKPDSTWHRNRLLFLALWLLLALIFSWPFFSPFSSANIVISSLLATLTISLSVIEYRSWKRTIRDSAFIESLSHEASSLESQAS